MRGQVCPFVTSGWFPPNARGLGLPLDCINRQIRPRGHKGGRGNNEKAQRGNAPRILKSLSRGNEAFHPENPTGVARHLRLPPPEARPRCAPTPPQALLHPARPPSPASVMPHFPKARNQLQLLMLTPLLHMASSGAVRTLPTLSFSLWSFLAGGAASGEDEASVSCLDNFTIRNRHYPASKNENCQLFFSFLDDKKRTLHTRGSHEKTTWQAFPRLTPPASLWVSRRGSWSRRGSSLLALPRGRG